MATDQWSSGDNFPEVPDEFVDQIWSSLFAKIAARPPADVDVKGLEVESQNKEEAESVSWA